MRRSGIRDDLIIYLQSPTVITLERLRGHSLRACNDMFVSALHDLHGLVWSELAVDTLPGGFSFSDETAAARAGRRGRKIWHALGAWPWSAFVDGNSHDGWHQDPLAEAFLHTWELGVVRPGHLNARWIERTVAHSNGDPKMAVGG